ncbi:MAG: hypothetical protein FWG53_06720 [Clostridiales bacterium]|nr:hypothetical protein [Clostridiales bacterium]
MKQFIVLAAVLPILMIFVMQAVNDQRSNFETSMVQDIVYLAKEEAKLEGSFTPYIQEKLRRDLCKALGLPPSEVLVSCWEDGDILHYRIEVPIKGVMAGSKLLGIKDEENQYSYVIDSYTVSKAK